MMGGTLKTKKDLSALEITCGLLGRHRPNEILVDHDVKKNPQMSPPGCPQAVVYVVITFCNFCVDDFLRNDCFEIIALCYVIA